MKKLIFIFIVLLYTIGYSQSKEALDESLIVKETKRFESLNIPKGTNGYFEKYLNYTLKDKKVSIAILSDMSPIGYKDFGAPFSIILVREGKEFIQAFSDTTCLFTQATITKRICNGAPILATKMGVPFTCNIAPIYFYWTGSKYEVLR
jgi:hypothetical protein